MICTLETQAQGRARMRRSLSYTIEQAEKAGLLFVREGKRPGPWHTIPKQMLRARCKSNWLGWSTRICSRVSTRRRS